MLVDRQAPPPVHYTHERCVRCRLRPTFCICAEFPQPPLLTKTRLVLIMHWREYLRASNTGQLAWQMLERSSLFLHGHPTTPIVQAELVGAGERVILMHPPAEGGPPARVIDAELAAEGPFTLLVPDGSWPQTHRMARRLGPLATAERVLLPAGPPTGYNALRRSAHLGQLATAEAIGRALAVLEGPDVGAAVKRIFTLFVERTVAGRRELGPPRSIRAG